MFCLGFKAFVSEGNLANNLVASTYSQERPVHFSQLSLGRSPAPEWLVTLQHAADPEGIVLNSDYLS